MIKPVERQTPVREQKPGGRLLGILMSWCWSWRHSTLLSNILDHDIYTSPLSTIRHRATQYWFNLPALRGPEPGVTRYCHLHAVSHLDRCKVSMIWSHYITIILIHPKCRENVLYLDILTFYSLWREGFRDKNEIRKIGIKSGNALLDHWIFSLIFRSFWKKLSKFISFYF